MLNACSLVGQMNGWMNKQKIAGTLGASAVGRGLELHPEGSADLYDQLWIAVAEMVTGTSLPLPWHTPRFAQRLVTSHQHVGTVPKRDGWTCPPRSNHWCVPCRSQVLAACRERPTASSRQQAVHRYRDPKLRLCQVFPRLKAKGQEA